MTNKINSRDVSFVLQGKNVKGQTSLCCKSIRKHFPNAEIIFSTYTDEDVSDLDFDVVVRSEDPGATKLLENWYNQTNRILSTTKAGLEKVSRPFCIKLRSDLCFDNDKLLILPDSFPKRNPVYSVFQKRVVFYQLYSRIFEVFMGNIKTLTPFHLSDWLCFGLTEDIKSYFNASSPTKEPEFSKHFLNPKNRLQGFFDPHVKWKFPPEQYFCTSFFKQFFKEADMLNSQDYSEEKSQKSREVLANNIILGGYEETGAYLLKKKYCSVSKNFRPSINEAWLGGVFTYFDFLSDYKKYCDPDFIMPFKYRWKKDLKISKYIKHFSKCMLPIKAFLHWIKDLLVLPYYTLRIMLNVLRYAPRTLYHEIRRRLS